MKKEYKVVGAMGGSSLDGLDLVLLSFVKDNSIWSYQIVNCRTYPYEENLHGRLKGSSDLSQDEQNKLDIDFGNWIGEKINHFLAEKMDEVDLCAVHGHTVVHKPKEGISWQLGNGQSIASKTGISTVTDFRMKDIRNRGQGAPLVPFGDFELFNEYDACLNLGGIANISIKGKRIAWDICPCNQVLNYYAQLLGSEYDNGGELAKKGNLVENFISEISKIQFFSQNPPKSLPNGFIPKSILDKVNSEDGLRSYVEFVSKQISNDLNIHGPDKGKLLVTGGGAFNSFLMERITNYLPSWEVQVPDSTIVSFKEALIFAFLGLKRVRNEINVLSSVTGASKDTSSGVIHFPK